MGNAYIILGQMEGFRGMGALVGVLFCSEQPTMKQLKGMGFSNIGQMDQAKTNGDAPKEPTLFVFDRSPAAREVTVAQVVLDGSRAKLGKKEIRKGDPHSILPEVEGPLAKRLLEPRGALGPKDIKKQKARKGFRKAQILSR